MNGFESGARKVIPAVLIYARANGRILMIHRTALEQLDDHSGKWNGLGGKLELDESPWEAAAREFKEEAGLSLDPARFQALGMLQFPNFKPHRNEDWLVFVMRVGLDPDEECLLSRSCPEGELHWVPEGEVLDRNLWPGDRHFVPEVLKGKPFMGTIWYSGREVSRALIREITRL